MRRTLSTSLAATVAAVVAVSAARGPSIERARALPAEDLSQATAARLYLPFLADRWTVRQLPRVAFSRPHGFADAAFQLELTTEAPEARIRYTLDGSPPDALRGSEYAGPITIDRTTVVRAVAVHPSSKPSDVATATYLFLADVVQQPPLPPGFPAAWGRFPEGPLAGDLIPADYAVDLKVTGDPRYAATIFDDLRSIPSLSVALHPDDLFGERGIYSNPLARGEEWVDPATGASIRPWERPASVEWLLPEGGPGFQIDAGIRIAGGWSRKPDSTAKHSFSLRFRSAYGPGRLRYALFDGPGPTSFDALRLRGGQADSFHYFADKAQYIHDQWGRDTQQAMGSPAARGRWVHLYLDGLYWGLYNVAEELEDAFMAGHMGGEAEDWDVIEAIGDGDDPGVVWRVEDGNDAAFIELLALRDASIAAGGPVDQGAYARAAAMIDLSQYIDFTLIQLYGDNWDWPHKNWTAARSRVLGGGFRFFIWDIEHMVQLRERDGICGPCSHHPNVSSCGTRRCGTSVDTAGAAGLHGWLLASPEYRMAFADRIRRHLLAGGALSPEATGARYRAVAEEVERAIVGESARWGDVPFGARTRNENWFFVAPFIQPNRVFTLDDHWRPERDRLLTTFFPERTGRVLQQFCDAGLYPGVAALRIVPAGPGVPVGTPITIEPVLEGCQGSALDGTIHYTLDGSDPRVPFSGPPDALWSGAPAPTALAYAGPIKPARYTRLRARFRAADGRWGPESQATIGVPRLALTEIMYHPAEDQALEFVELVSRERTDVDLSGVTVHSGITAVLPAGTLLRPGQRIVLAADPAAFGARYPGVVPLAAYDGQLANSGERVQASDAAGNVLLDVTYDDGGYWPLAADGLGFSLVMDDLDADPRDPEAWRASAAVGGSPGAVDPPPPYAGAVVIDEVLANSDAPYEDAIELHNAATDPGAWVDISGWYLSDDRDEPRKLRVPDGTWLAPGGHAAFYERAFRDLAPPGRGFGLSSDGETVYLLSADAAGAPTGYFRGMAFGPSDPNTAIIRIRHAGGADTAQAISPTFGVSGPQTVEDFRTGRGAPNAPPRVGPVVIAEIHPRPAAGEPQFVELVNTSSDPVLLGGDADARTGPWSLSEGVSFAFPPGAVLPPGGYAVVGGLAPAALAAGLGLPEGVQAFGPWLGRLSADGERLALARPRVGQTASLEDGPWVVVDAVRYALDPPWRAATVRAGASLERLDLGEFAGDPLNWIALHQGGTPGRAAAPLYRVFVPFNPR